MPEWQIIPPSTKNDVSVADLKPHVDHTYHICDHPESLAVSVNIHQLHSRVLVLANPTAFKASQIIVQIVVGLAAIPRRGYHHHVDWVRGVNLRE